MDRELWMPGKLHRKRVSGKKSEMKATSLLGGGGGAEDYTIARLCWPVPGKSSKGEWTVKINK